MKKIIAVSFALLFAMNISATKESKVTSCIHQFLRIEEG